MQADQNQTERQRWISLLAQAPLERLEEAWAALDERPAYEFLRLAETGLVMVRGRAGGTGQKFNLGEMTLTRCTVRTDSGETGFGYVSGAQPRHAELAALFDALLQRPELREQLAEQLVEPIAAELSARHTTASRKAAATRVNFFTVARES